MERAIPRKFDPKTMKVDKNDPKVVYVSTMMCEESVAYPQSGHILIGTKDNPSEKKIAEVIRHEKSHLGRRHAPIVGIANLDNLSRIRNELRAYNQERKLSLAQEWNNVLPSRIRQFMGYLTWVSKPNQRRIKPQAKRILAPKKGGGNEQAIRQARVDLAQWWLEEEKIPTRLLITATKRPIEDIRRDIRPRVSVEPAKPRRRIRLSHGVYADTKGQRISRRRHRRWERIY